MNNTDKITIIVIMGCLVSAFIGYSIIDDMESRIMDNYADTLRPNVDVLERKHEQFDKNVMKNPMKFYDDYNEFIEVMNLTYSIVTVYDNAIIFVRGPLIYVYYPPLGSNQTC